MKKHLFFPLCLCFLLAPTLFNCSNPTEPGPRIFTGTTNPPKFEGSGSNANEFDNLTRDFVRVSSTLTTCGSHRIIQHGHVWSSTHTYPELYSNPSEPHQYSPLGYIGESEAYPYRFTSYVSGLQSGTTYHVRAYVTTDEGTFYGPTSTFSTLEKSQD